MKVGVIILIGLVVVVLTAAVVGTHAKGVGYKTGYDIGYTEGEYSGLAQNITITETSDYFLPPHQCPDDDFWQVYEKPEDIELRLAEKLIEAMSKAELDFVIENGDITSGRIHITWEKD